MKVKTYKGINPSDFSEISRYLKQGYAVDFRCALSSYGYDHEDKKYRTYVDTWVQRIQTQSSMRGYPIHTQYLSPDNPECLRISLLPDKNIVKNASAKFLLSETY